MRPPDGAPGWHEVCRLADLPSNEPAPADVDGVAVCLVSIDGRVYAVHDECTHAAVPLSEGEVLDGAIECWMHGSRFDLATGRVLNLPATRDVAAYPVVVAEDGVVWIRLEPPS